MKILVVGSGGREHALVWKIKQSPLCDQIWCAPGNAGIREEAEIVPLPVNDIQSLTAWAKKEQMDLVVVGPEAPLADGIVDLCRSEGICAFGPTRAAAQIESSKIFTRRLLQKYGIPSPLFDTFTSPDPAKQYIEDLTKQGKQVVVKADGLAAGKGAMVTSNSTEAFQAVDLCMKQKAFGEAGTKIVVEERLSGPELSILAITDGKYLTVLPPAQDHKPIGEDDTGPNTGGMGAYSPVPIVDEKLLNLITETILEPTIRGMQKEGTPYQGTLYAGLMICNGKPYVIEFNCRFGDPETQAVLPAISEDITPLLLASAQGKMTESRIIRADQSVLCVVMASQGYPQAYEKGKEIQGLSEVTRKYSDKARVFHAGTAIKEGKIVTSGGRVLGVCGWGEQFDDAYKNAYQAVRAIHFEGAYYRRDIGYRVRRG